jgi:DNA invertase Pin-like site-specific DNA recombinase
MDIQISNEPFIFVKILLDSSEQLDDTPYRMKYVIYRRVSTQKQLASNLGLLGQETAINNFLRSQPDHAIVNQFCETESGKNDARPMLAEAIKICKKEGATLLVSTLSRLTRSLAFLTQIESSGVQIRCADMPEMNNLILHIMGSINSYELDLVKSRTSAALQELKKSGVKLGNPRPDIAKMNDGATKAKTEFAVRMASIVAEIRLAGILTLQGVADCLNRRGYLTRNNKQWFPSSVRNLLAAIPLA